MINSFYGGGLFSLFLLKKKVETLFCTVTPTALNYASGSDSKSFNISSNTDWTITKNQAWITISKTSGSNNDTINMLVENNPNTTTRQGVVTVSWSGGSIEIEVNQEAAEAVCTATPLELFYPALGESQEITITSNTGWTISDDRIWITASQSSGSGNGVINIICSNNTKENSRAGIVTISWSEGSIQISIVQAGNLF